MLIDDLIATESARQMAEVRERVAELAADSAGETLPPRQIQDGDKVTYKVGRGRATGTVANVNSETGQAAIRTEAGKVVPRKIADLLKVA